MTTRRVFTVAETAERLGCSTWSVYKLIREGQLQAIRIGRVTRIPHIQLARFLGETTDTSAVAPDPLAYVEPLKSTAYSTPTIRPGAVRT